MNAHLWQQAQNIEDAVDGADDDELVGDVPPACEDCGGESGAPSSACPQCRKVVCQLCAEREGVFCCDEAKEKSR